jgi:tetratricopeptide (TPR) repeat protein
MSAEHWSAPFEAPAPVPVEPVAAPVAQVQQEVPAADEPTAVPTAPLPAPEQIPAPALAASTVQQATPSAPPAPLVPAYRADALLENELETTMRRPAVRLQPLQAAARSGAGSLATRGRPVERKPASEGPLSPKEQLVRGYQYQLAGAYDDAMQDYRVVIRNAPELLDEIISNLRALIKLAPRYTAGYRVLGDAYMRQGQYLQAMEAYNKALTIAKKAKSQTR